MNKKASEKINTGIFLLFLVLIVGGVTFALSLYVNSPIDVRSYESRIIYDKIMNCMISNGFIDSGFLESEDRFNFCGLNRKAFDTYSLYFEFVISDSEGKEVGSFVGGELSERNERKQDCEVMQGTKTKELSACLFEKEKYLYFNGEKIVEVEVNGWVASFNEGFRA